VSNCAEQAQKTVKTSDFAICFDPHDSVGHLLATF